MKRTGAASVAGILAWGNTRSFSEVSPSTEFSSGPLYQIRAAGPSPATEDKQDLGPAFPYPAANNNARKAKWVRRVTYLGTDLLSSNGTKIGWGNSATNVVTITLSVELYIQEVPNGTFKPYNLCTTPAIAQDPAGALYPQMFNNEQRPVNASIVIAVTKTISTTSGETTATTYDVNPTDPANPEQDDENDPSDTTATDNNLGIDLDSLNFSSNNSNDPIDVNVTGGAPYTYNEENNTATLSPNPFAPKEWHFNPPFEVGRFANAEAVPT